MNPKFRTLTETFFVAPQIAVDDLKDAAAMGVRLIINNRPDGEEPGQPTTAEIRKAAQTLGLAYVAIPVTGVASIRPADLDAFDAAVAGAGGAVLAHCKSGTRSTVLRALSRARAGAEVGAILEEAAEAGYDLSGLAAQLAALRQ
jgi:uncharacterized protein (TIGR01244 family)